MPSAIPEEIKQALANYPAPIAKRLKQMRRVILRTARGMDIGALEETTKWGEPAYLPATRRTGTAVRLGAKIDSPDGQILHCRMYVNCQTTLVQTFKTLFPEFTYEGNRGVLFPLSQSLPEQEFAVMVEAALTYHRNKSKGR